MNRNFLLVDPERNLDVLKALASEVRVSILKLLAAEGPRNVNDIAAELGLPQSTVSANVQILVGAGLIETETRKAAKGNQKICHSLFGEVLVAFPDGTEPIDTNVIEVSMPLGLYTSFDVTAPCGLCSPEGIIGLLDVPNTFYSPGRMSAALMWFTRGFVEYQFPNNARLEGRAVREVEVSLELSSEVPGTSADWPSDITITVNGVDIGTWTSPGDFGDSRGVYTPDWWKLRGSQYGKMKSFRVTGQGTFVDGVQLSPVTPADLGLEEHHSVRVRIGVREDAKHPGGVNIFGRGFGNYDQDIVLRLDTGTSVRNPA